MTTLMDLFCPPNTKKKLKFKKKFKIMLHLPLDTVVRNNPPTPNKKTTTTNWEGIRMFRCIVQS